MIILLPNGRFQLATYWLSIMSSLVGLVGRFQAWTTDGHPPKGGCDHVHIGYSHKFISNDMAGAHACDAWAATSSRGMMPTGGSSSTSTNSRTCKQAVTLEKPCGGVGSLVSTKACIDGEGCGGVGVFGGETAAL